MLGVSYATPMTKYRITLTIRTDDVTIGIVTNVARAAAFALCQPTGKGNSLLDLTEGYRLSVGVYALNANEAIRTAEVMVGAIRPITFGAKVHEVVEA